MNDTESLTDKYEKQLSEMEKELSTKARNEVPLYHYIVSLHYNVSVLYHYISSYYTLDFLNLISY